DEVEGAELDRFHGLFQRAVGGHDDYGKPRKAFHQGLDHGKPGFTAEGKIHHGQNRFGTVHTPFRFGDAMGRKGGISFLLEKNFQKAAKGYLIVNDEHGGFHGANYRMQTAPLSPWEGDVRCGRGAVWKTERKWSAGGQAGLKREAESPSLPPETGSGAFGRQQRVDLALVIGSRVLGDSGLVAAGRLIQHGKEDGDFGEDRFLFVRGADFLQARLDRGADRAIG